MYYIKYLFLKLLTYTYYKLNNFKSFKESRISDYFHLFWILVLGSNHPNRFELFMHRRKKINEFEKIYWKSNNSANNIYIIVGDSHSELYGRNYNSNYDKNCKFITLWLGPILLIKFLKSHSLMNRSIFFINKIINIFGRSKTYHIIFSFGEIDIRSFFFRTLELNKSYKNIDILLNNYSKLIRNRINEMRNNINKKNHIYFYFKEPPPTTSKNGYLPKNRNEMIKIYNTEDCPIFGKVIDRVNWYKKFKKKFLENIDLYNYLENSQKCFNINGTLNNDISDSIHVNSEEIIQEFQNKLINYK